MSDLVYKGSHPSENAKHIEHQIENRLAHSHNHDTRGIIYDEVHKLRQMDSAHGKLNQHQFSADLQSIDHSLHQKHLLPHMHIVGHGNRMGELVSDKKKDERNHSAADPDGAKTQKSKSDDKREGMPGAHESVQHTGKPGGHEAKAHHGKPGAHAAPKSRPGRGAQPGSGAPEPAGDDSVGPEAGASPQPAAPSADGRSQGQSAESPYQGAADASSDAAQNGSGQLSSLNSAIERAKAGGRPLTIAQIGDSHIAHGTETPALAGRLAADNGLRPDQVQFSSHGNVGKTASYANQHPDEFLKNINRNTDMVVVSFGSNEAGQRPDGKYARDYAGLIAKVRERAPGAAIVMAGPTDGNFWGSNRHLPYLNEVLQTQQAIASRVPDGAYVRAGAQMGSVASMKQQGLISSDNLHLTSRGYQRLGAILADDITDILRK